MSSAKKFSLVAGELLIAYSVITALSEKVIARLALLDFTRLFNRAYVGLALLLLLLLVFTSNARRRSVSTRTGWGWTAGLGVMLLISTWTVYYANPHGRFPTQRYLFTVPAARNIKSALYEKTDYDPQLIIMGTSRAFTFSSDYLYQKTGYQTYNFSVEGAKVIDNFWQLNYILHRQAEPPRALLIEFGDPRLLSGLTPAKTARVTFGFQPLSMLPYFSLSQQKEVLLAYGEDILSVRSFSDSVYLMIHPHLTSDKQTWAFQADGYAIRQPITHENYLASLEMQINSLRDSVTGAGYFCAHLERDGEELLKQLIANAQQHQIGVVLYQSPVNGTLLQKELMPNEQFYKCQNLLSDFMNDLKREYKNVWYISLLDYQPITEMSETGFYDGYHLRPNASQAVIDQLIPSLQAAVQWSEAQKK
jgi:hypothetical protein